MFINISHTHKHTRAQLIAKIDILFLIADPEIKYINLTSQHPATYYQAESGGIIQWVIYVDGYPKPHLQW